MLLLSRDLHLYLVSANPYGEGLDVAGNGRPQAFASFDLEAACVQRTFNDVAIEPSVGEQRKGVRADVAGREDFAAEVVERNLLVAYRNAGDLALGDCRARCNGHPFSTVRHEASLKRSKNRGRIFAGTVAFGKPLVVGFLGWLAGAGGQRKERRRAGGRTGGLQIWRN